MKAEIVEKMSKSELHSTAKKFGIKYGKLSLMQIREALIAAGDEPPKKEKTKKVKQDGPREGSKMALAMKIFQDNKDKARKEILALFQSKAKLTKAGSSTYYQLVQKRLKQK